jgi:tetratricopeptide (TPR) repeat protein
MHNDYTRAESLLKVTVVRNSNSIPVLASYVLLEKARSHWAEAIHWQTKRIAADPAPPVEALGLLGELNFRAGNHAGAAHAYMDLLRRDAYNNDAHRVLGEIFRSAKRWDDARTQLEVVVRYSPAGDPGQYISLADVYRNLGRPNDAQRMLDKGKRIFPGNSYLLHAAAE